MILNAGLIVDFGNSETRAMVLASNKTIELTLSNKFVDLQPRYKYPAQYQNDKSNVFLHEGTYYANGQIVEREFIGREMRPVAIEPKTDQQVTELSLNLVIMKAMLELEKLYNVAVSELDVTFNISVLLPPLEHDTNEDNLKNIIRKTTHIEALVPKQVDLQFKIADVNVYPEGFAAFFGALFKEENGELVEVPENTQYTSGYILVLDIGAGTTDVVIIKDSELLLSSKDTFPLGGNTVDSYVANQCRKEFGFLPQNITQVVMTGELTEGAKKHYIENIITDAKENYSQSMMVHIRSYLERLMLPVKEIKGILIVGGGSVASVRDGEQVSPPMSEVMMKYLNRLAPNTQMVQLGNISPRKINVVGLKYMHKYS